MKRKLNLSTFKPYTPRISDEIGGKKNASYVTEDIIFFIKRRFQRIYQPLSELTMPTIEYLMAQAGGNWKRILGYNTIINEIISFDLLYYLTNSDSEFTITEDESKYILSLKDSQLIQLLGPRYKGFPRDRASLLFAAMSGLSSRAPDLDSIPAYKIIMAKTSANLWKLADFLGIMDFDRGFISPYSPHIYAAMNFNPSIHNQTLIDIWYRLKYTTYPPFEPKKGLTLHYKREELNPFDLSLAFYGSYWNIYYYTGTDFILMPVMEFLMTKVDYIFFKRIIRSIIFW